VKSFVATSPVGSRGEVDPDKSSLGLGLSLSCTSSVSHGAIKTFANLRHFREQELASS